MAYVDDKKIVCNWSPGLGKPVGGEWTAGHPIVGDCAVAPFVDVPIAGVRRRGATRLRLKGTQRPFIELGRR